MRRHLGTTTWHGDDGLGLRHEADHLVDVEGDLDHPAPERSKHSGHDRFGPGDLGRLKENRRPGEYLIHDLVARALRQETRPPDRPAGRRYGSLAVRRPVGPSVRQPVGAGRRRLPRMSIIGVGIDVAEIDRFRASLDRTPGLADRLFVRSELLLPSGERRGIASLAARFAAKEALAKALGAPPGLHWTDAEVYVEDSGRPRLRVSGTVAARAAELGVRSWHVSLSHDAGIASAVVVAEG